MSNFGPAPWWADADHWHQRDDARRRLRAYGEALAVMGRTTAMTSALMRTVQASAFAATFAAQIPVIAETNTTKGAT